MARLATKPVKGEWGMRQGENCDAYLKRTDAMFKVLSDADAAIPDDGSVIGALLSFPVADGCAMYRVSKESPLTLEHIPCGDAWRIPDAHIRGIRKADVLERLCQSRAMGKMFR